jgi:hypothetical protein
MYAEEPTCPFILPWTDKASLVSIAGLTVTNSRKQTVVAILPNAYPASRVVAKKDAGDNSVIEYVQVRLICLDVSGGFANSAIGS